ncbi:hypothetical protein T484DRAFT_1949504 [Baffinella frigidus]|nr:hypothetical protein T484DRAFT_1949504 [Cryptophyta sp. CCMP2293]
MGMDDISVDAFLNRSEARQDSAVRRTRAPSREASFEEGIEPSLNSRRFVFKAPSREASFERQRAPSRSASSVALKALSRAASSDGASMFALKPPSPLEGSPSQRRALKATSREPSFEALRGPLTRSRGSRSVPQMLGHDGFIRGAASVTGSSKRILLSPEGGGAPDVKKMISIKMKDWASGGVASVLSREMGQGLKFRK